MMSRAEKAGRHMARSIIEMVNLMYQDRTALHFYDGLVTLVKEEYEARVKVALSGKETP